MNKRNATHLGWASLAFLVIVLLLTQPAVGTFILPLFPDTTAFGETAVAEPTPVVQLQFPYNINTDIIEKRENNAGTITQAGGMAVMQTGASANSAAHMLSILPLKYNSGQGALVRFTAIYTTGVADSIQVAGVGEVGDGLFFGYNGTAFSIDRREAGMPEIQTLSVTTGAVTATGNITINVDSVAKVVAVTSGDTARQVAVKIADADFSDTGLGWSATVDNATIIFKAWSGGDKSGTFTLADTDTTGTVGTFDETVAGVATTNNWVAQASWSEDVSDGTGPGGMTLDPTKGNVYQIRYQWLGYGAIEFSVENSATGDFQLVHRIEYANAKTTPSLQNPTLPLHIMAKNNANTTNLTIKTSSMAGFIEGIESTVGLLRSSENTIGTLGTTELPILSIKNKVVYQSTLNRVGMEPEFLSLSTESTKPIIFRVRLNATLTGTPAFTDIDTSNSVISVDKAATGLTGGRQLFSVVLGKVDSQLVSFHDLRKRLVPGSVLTLTAEATSGSNQEPTVSLNWTELF